MSARVDGSNGHAAAEVGEANGDEQPRRIYQSVMDQINQAYFDANFDAYSNLMILPHRIETLDRVTTIATRTDLERTFDNVLTFLRDNRVTGYVRICVGARFTQDGLIEGTHESHIMDGMRYVRPRFAVTSVLQADNGVWRGLGSITKVDRYSDLPSAAGPTDWKQKQNDATAQRSETGDG